MSERFLLFYLLSMFSTSLLATTIVAPKNLPELGHMSDAVVYAKCVDTHFFEENGVSKHRFTFILIDRIKGQIKENFVVQNLHFKIGDLERTVISDVDFEPEKHYLLFLSQRSGQVWQTRMLSYGIYQEDLSDGRKILSPMMKGAHGVINQEEVEPLYNYDQSKLLPLLKQAIQHGGPWKSIAAKVQPSIAVQLRAAPSHCDFFASNTYPRWNGFPNTTLPIRVSSSGDAGCSQAANNINEAINIMNSTYSGINISYAGTHNYSPPGGCGDATGQGLIDFVNNTYNTSRMLLIQYNDPCNEMNNLRNCSGVLAYGGIYWSGSTYTENGKTYRYALYGHVVTNNGFGSCYCNNGTYIYTMIHELGHTLGFGHIESSFGKANMNPSNPGPITALDISCFDYLYPGSGSNCNSIENVREITIRSNTTVQATQLISLNNVTVTNSATLTLIAPSIELNTSTQLNNNARLITITENQCN